MAHVGLYDPTIEADLTVVNGPGPDPTQPIEHRWCHFPGCKRDAVGTGRELTAQGWVWIRGTETFFGPCHWLPDEIVIPPC